MTSVSKLQKQIRDQEEQIKLLTAHINKADEYWSTQNRNAQFKIARLQEKVKETNTPEIENIENLLERIDSLSNKITLLESENTRLKQENLIFNNQPAKKTQSMLIDSIAARKLLNQIEQQELEISSLQNVNANLEDQIQDISIYEAAPEDITDVEDAKLTRKVSYNVPNRSSSGVELISHLERAKTIKPQVQVAPDMMKLREDNEVQAKLIETLMGYIQDLQKKMLGIEDEDDD